MSSIATAEGSTFKQPIALQPRLAALGNSHDSSGLRWVQYRTAEGDVRVPFSGGIIAISNLALDGHRLQLCEHSSAGGLSNRASTEKVKLKEVETTAAVCDHER